MGMCLFAEETHSNCEHKWSCLYLFGMKRNWISCFETVHLATAATPGQKGAIKGNLIFCLCSKTFSMSGSELAIV